MPMGAGQSNFIEYLWHDGHTRRASLRNTDVHSIGLPFQNTDDSKWFVEDLTNNVDHGEFEWLVYMNPDLQGHRSDWRVKVHCEFQQPSFIIKLTSGGSPNLPPPQVGGPTFGGQPPSDNVQYIHPWFEHIQTNGNGKHPDTAMVFVAPDGTAWRADIQRVYHWPAPPTFVLTPLSGIPVEA
jgi:hypothetical protein